MWGGHVGYRCFGRGRPKRQRVEVKGEPARGLSMHNTVHHDSTQNCARERQSITHLPNRGVLHVGHRQERVQRGRGCGCVHEVQQAAPHMGVPSSLCSSANAPRHLHELRSEGSVIKASVGSGLCGPPS